MVNRNASAYLHLKLDGDQRLHFPRSWFRIILLISSVPPVFAVGEDLVRLLDFHEAFLGFSAKVFVLHFVWVMFAGQATPC